MGTSTELLDFCSIEEMLDSKTPEILDSQCAPLLGWFSFWVFTTSMRSRTVFLGACLCAAVCQEFMLWDVFIVHKLLRFMSFVWTGPLSCLRYDAVRGTINIYTTQRLACSECHTSAPHSCRCFLTATHRAESVSTQTAFAVQAADLRLRAGLRHPLEERPEQTQTFLGYWVLIQIFY